MIETIIIITLAVVIVAFLSVGLMPPKKVVAAPDPRRYLRDMRKREMAEWDKEFNRLSGIPERKPYTWNPPTTAELDHQFWVQMVKENIVDPNRFSKGGVIPNGRG